MTPAKSARQGGTAGIPLNRGRLRRRLLFWFLLFSLVPLLLTNSVGYQRSEGIIRRRTERHLSAVAEVEAQHIRDRIDRNALLLRATVGGNDFLVASAIDARRDDAGAMEHGSTRPVVERYLQQQLDQVGAFAAITLTTPNGRVIATAGQPGFLSPDLPAGPPPSFAAGVARDERGLQPVIQLSVPVQGIDLRPVGFLLATIRLGGAGGILSIPALLAGRIESFVIDSASRPLFVSHPHREMNYQTPLTSPLVSMAPGSRAHYRDADGIEVIGTMIAIPDYPLRYIAQVPATEAFGALLQLRRLLLGIEVVLVALLGWAAWIVARSIVAPLRRLVDASRQVAKGDLEVRVVVGDPDELGELERAFNEMTGALAESTRQVDRLHQREIERASQLATVGELASGVAHEIRNPVAGVSSGLDLVRQRLGTGTSLAPIMDEMARQLARIQRRLHELLTFAPPATPHLAPVPGNRAVDRGVRLVQPTAQRAGVEIDLALDPADPKLRIDEEMVNQALVNVLMNAVEATPRGGRIEVRTTCTGDHVEITVVDTGRGIARQHLEQVFKPFFTTRHTGTGLGLSITRQILERHGGGITLTSNEGHGTRVVMRLPLAVVEEPAEAAVVSPR